MNCLLAPAKAYKSQPIDFFDVPEEADFFEAHGSHASHRANYEDGSTRLRAVGEEFPQGNDRADHCVHLSSERPCSVQPKKTPIGI